MNGVIDGFPEMGTKVGLRDVVGKPQLKGLWTWTRGGGWCTGRHPSVSRCCG